MKSAYVLGAMQACEVLYWTPIMLFMLSISFVMKWLISGNEHCLEEVNLRMHSDVAFGACYNLFWLCQDQFLSNVGL